jgi:hypothetical protein
MKTEEAEGFWYFECTKGNDRRKMYVKRVAKSLMWTINFVAWLVNCFYT